MHMLRIGLSASVMLIAFSRIIILISSPLEFTFVCYVSSLFSAAFIPVCSLKSGLIRYGIKPCYGIFAIIAFSVVLLYTFILEIAA